MMSEPRTEADWRRRNRNVIEDAEAEAERTDPIQWALRVVGDGASLIDPWERAYAMRMYGRLATLDAARQPTVDVEAPKAPVVDMFEDVRRWVAAIGSTDLDTGRRITKADALLVIDRMLEDFR